jgi:uncharacterized protein YcfL
MTRPTLLAALIAAPCLLAGCDTTRPPAAATPDPLPPVSYPQIATDEELKGSLHYALPIIRSQPDTPMKVTVPLRLREDEAVNAQYRFTFMDAVGAPVGQPADWRFMVLPPRLQVFMEGVAMSPEAADWRLEIRPAR